MRGTECKTSTMEEPCRSASDLSARRRVGDCTVFNIRGNHYRLICGIRYERQVIYIKYVLTHKQYDLGGWKNGCEGD
jgi:mRNA-degrading endonuclease HigB of HigAB toxin-antitoxin module